ncbi:hypothetical protein QFZ96_006208, partial [Paraburkholderia youngii]
MLSIVGGACSLAIARIATLAVFELASQVSELRRYAGEFGVPAVFDAILFAGAST